MRLRRVVAAVDCGIAVNPSSVEAQIQGGLIFGLSAALYSGITLKNGAIEQSNFHDYRILRINEAPLVEVYRIENNEPPGGLGEVGTAIAAPALANAIFAATGVRLRELPIDPKLLVQDSGALKSVIAELRHPGHGKGTGMKRLLIVIVVLVILGAAALALLSRTDRAAGTAPGVAGAPPSADDRGARRILDQGGRLRRLSYRGRNGQAVRRRRGVQAVRSAPSIRSNITSDPTYGIGSYSDDEFVRAVREGVRRDGQHLYPAFPYTSYTQLSRDDVLAIKAYLWTLPPAAQPNRANELGFPFNQRWAMAFWNAAFFKSSRFAAGSREIRAMEQRRLSRDRLGALRRVPHAAQFRLRARARPRALGRGAAGLARL